MSKALSEMSKPARSISRSLGLNTCVVWAKGSSATRAGASKRTLLPLSVSSPVMIHGDAWIAHGFGETLDQAMRMAAEQMLWLLTDRIGLSLDDAYSLSSVAVDFGVTQVVGRNLLAGPEVVVEVFEALFVEIRIVHLFGSLLHDFRRFGFFLVVSFFLSPRCNSERKSQCQ